MKIPEDRILREAEVLKDFRFFCLRNPRINYSFGERINLKNHYKI